MEVQELQSEINEILNKIAETERTQNAYYLGENLFKTGNVQMLSQGNDFAEVSVEDFYDDFQVSFNFQEKLAGDCSCKSKDWCSHRVAGIMEVQDSLNRFNHKNEEGRKYTREGMIKRVLEERKSRANIAKYTIAYADNVHGEHKLINQKGVSYKITFRDFDRREGYCSCSDYATSKLGTCKHLIFAFNNLKLDKKDISTQYFPFVEIYLDPLNDYRISLYYPHSPSAEIQELINTYFEGETFIPENKVKLFFGFVKEAKQHKQILIRPEVLDKIEEAFDQSILEQKKATTQLDFSGIKADLYPYQKEGVEFATFSKGAIIADEMGLGKTIQAISTAVLKKSIFGFKKTLIICPASLKSQWQSEIKKFSTEKAEIIEGSPEERARKYKESDAYFLIINYETVLRDLQAINKANIDFVILDEAQRIKNFETITANAIKGIKKSHCLVITGTPIENKLTDIYSIVGFINPKILAPLWEFSYQHCYFDKYNENKITGYYDLQRLKERLKPFLIRREKREVLQQLNNVTQVDVPVEMHPQQQEFHASYAQAIASILGKKFKTPYDWQQLTMNLQSMRMTCDSTYLVDKDTNFSPKLIELEEILLQKLDLPNNERKIIIFSEWVTMLGIIGKLLAKNGIGYTELTGKVAVKNRKKAIKEFEDNPKCRVFLSTEAGGAGLNLQVADTLINFELPWNPAKKNQRIGRIDRLGQKNKNLTVINLITRASIEMKIMGGLVLKQNLFDSVLNSDNQVNEVDFSEQGKSQFLQELEASMSEFLSPQEEPNQEEVVESIVDEFIVSEEEMVEEKSQREQKEAKLAEMEAVMNKGMEFLTGLFKMSTGKDLSAGQNKIEIDKETGEVVMRFKVDF